MATNGRRNGKAPSIGQMRATVRGALSRNAAEAQRLAEKIVPGRRGRAETIYDEARDLISDEAWRQLAATDSFDLYEAAVHIRRGGYAAAAWSPGAAMFACQALDAFDFACHVAAETECAAALNAARASRRR